MGSLQNGNGIGSLNKCLGAFGALFTHAWGVACHTTLYAESGGGVVGHVFAMVLVMRLGAPFVHARFL